jgi:hypothetical protein
MKNFLIISMLLITGLDGFGQDFDYGGTYSYGTSPDSGSTGLIYIYPNSDSTNLFYLELNRGYPSYNSGEIVGQMNIYNLRKAEFSMTKGEYIDCSMNFWFTNDSLYIRTNDQSDNCGYGYGVHSHSNFKLKDSKTPEFYYDMTGEKIYFKNLD